MPEDRDPDLIFVGGPDELHLEEGGKAYRPGDVMPKNLSHAKRVSLVAAGVRFETRHYEPVLTPDGKPAELSAAEQIDPPAGGPAVVAAVEAVPADEPKPDQPRRAVKEKD